MVKWIPDIFGQNNLSAILGSRTNGSGINKRLEPLLRKFESSLIVHEPIAKEINSERDNWKCYDFQERGLIIEVVADVVSCLSFSSGLPTVDGSIPIPRYKYNLPFELNFDLSRKIIRKNIRQ